MLTRLLAGLVDASRRHATAVVLAGVLLAAFSAWFAADHLGVSTDTDQMFAENLPWRQREAEMNKDFPQFRDLLVAVVDARVPEEAEATAAALAKAAAADPAHFASVRRPDTSPYFEKEGLLFLEPKQLSELMDQTIDAQPFLGQLVADPSARGLFAALSLLGMGVTQGDADLGPYLGPITRFHEAMADSLAGHPRPLSWQTLLGAGLEALAGPYHFVLIQPRLDFGALEPGGAATRALRTMIADMEFVKSGSAHVRITGQVPLADEEFSTVAEGAVEGLIGSVVLITLWLFLALRSWRLIVPVLMTLVLGLMLTLLFATLAVGTLNLVSVGFGVLFVGIAVDFGIQFLVRYRDRRFVFADPAVAMRETTTRAGAQILIAALATSAGFLAFVPTDFSGVAELGLIAGVGMLIAFACTLVFLPAATTLLDPRAEQAEIGFRWGAPADAFLTARRWPVLAVFGCLAVLALVMVPRLRFDSDPLHTKNPNTEAMRTLHDLSDSPLTNPYTIDVLVPSVQAAGQTAERIRALPSVDSVIDVNSFVPEHQQENAGGDAQADDVSGAEPERR